METPKINWINLPFFVITTIASIVGVYWRFQDGGVPIATWAFTFFMVYATGFGITAGYHRLFSHKSYEAHWFVRLMLLLFGAAAFQASARWWSAEHRHHHRYVDTDRDPYGINKGFWYAHIGWLIRRHDQEVGFAGVKDLDRDPLVLWQDRYYLPLATIMCFGFPTLIASFWGDPWGGLVVAGVARMVFVQQWTWCINSVAHTFGKQTYSDKHSAKDHWFTSLFTYGEGYHNFHHEFPSDYRNGHLYYHWDPTKWLIRSLAFFGLSHDLRRTDKTRILQARLSMDHKRVTRQWVKNPATAQKISDLTDMIERARGHLQTAQTRFLTLKNEYKDLKTKRVQSMTDQVQTLKTNMKQARKDFQRSMAEWKQLIRQQQVSG